VRGRRERDHSPLAISATLSWAYVRAMGSDLVHVHVSDVDRLLPGEGRVDWFGLMQTLQEYQFEGYVTMELGLDSRLVDPDKIARTALKFLKDVESKLDAERKMEPDAS